MTTTSTTPPHHLNPHRHRLSISFWLLESILISDLSFNLIYGIRTKLWTMLGLSLLRILFVEIGLLSIISFRRSMSRRSRSDRRSSRRRRRSTITITRRRRRRSLVDNVNDQDSQENVEIPLPPEQQEEQEEQDLLPPPPPPPIGIHWIGSHVLIALLATLWYFNEVVQRQILLLVPLPRHHHSQQHVLLDSSNSLVVIHRIIYWIHHHLSLLLKQDQRFIYPICSLIFSVVEYVEFILVVRRHHGPAAGELNSSSSSCDLLHHHARSSSRPRSRSRRNTLRSVVVNLERDDGFESRPITTTTSAENIEEGQGGSTLIIHHPEASSNTHNEIDTSLPNDENETETEPDTEVETSSNPESDSDSNSNSNSNSNSDSDENDIIDVPLHSTTSSSRSLKSRTSRISLRQHVKRSYGTMNQEDEERGDSYLLPSSVGGSLGSMNRRFSTTQSSLRNRLPIDHVLEDGNGRIDQSTIIGQTVTAFGGI